jgi:hypothetical protein
LPHLNQAEIVVVFDILENAMTQTAFLSSDGINQCQKGLFEFQTFFGHCIRFYDDDDHGQISLNIYIGQELLLKRDGNSSIFFC